jgi:hypothetical protein
MKPGLLGKQFGPGAWPAAFGLRHGRTGVGLGSRSVTTVLPIPILAEGGFSDIREIVHLPNYWPWIIAAVVLLLAAAVLLWRRRPRPEAEPVPEPGEAPDLKALRLLQQLQEKGDALEAEAFTVEVSSILRHYLEEALRLPAPGQTSEEFLQDLRRQSWLTPDLQQNLEDFMHRADLVKFARQNLGHDQRIRFLGSARHVVDATRPQLEPAAS